MSEVSAGTENERVKQLEIGLQKVVQTLELMLDTMEQNANLLNEIAAAVRDDPGESPVVKSLDELVSAVVTMSAGIESVRANLDELPEKISHALTHESE